MNACGVAVEGGEVEQNATSKGKKGSHRNYWRQPLGELHQRHYGPCYQRNRGARATRPEYIGYEGPCVATVTICMSMKLGWEKRIIRTPDNKSSSASESFGLLQRKYETPSTAVSHCKYSHNLSSSANKIYRSTSTVSFRLDKRGGVETHITDQ